MLLLHRANAARAALLLGAGLWFATPIWAQNTALNAAADNAATAPLRQALNAEKTPLRLSASALDASWRRFRPNAALRDTVIASSGYADTTDETAVAYSFVTRGETLAVGAETFLISYRGQFDFEQMPVDLQEDLRIELEQTGLGIETSDGYARLLSSQVLQLCLLNVRNLGDLTDVRAFDSKSDLIKVLSRTERESLEKRAAEQVTAERAQLDPQQANQRVVSDLKQVGLAMSMYIQDYDEKVPPMRSSQSMADIKKYAKREWDSPKLATAQQVLGPYVKSYEIFAHPTTREIYRPNLNVSGRSLASLYASSPRVITFYEATPAPDGTRAVLYLDGHVRRERETDWPAIRAASDKIAPPLQFGKRVLSAKPASGTVTLSGAAAMAYTIAQWKKNPQHTQALYLSKSVNRVYYRDDETHKAIWVDPPAKGIVLPTVQAAPFRAYKGYNGQTKGRVLSDDFEAV